MEYTDEKLNLEIIAEEAAEVVRIKSKCIRFGMDNFHPKNGHVNRAALVREIGHFLAMVNILSTNGTISENEILEGILEKEDNLVEWYKPKKTIEHIRDETAGDGDA